MNSSEYINEERRTYALYTIANRAIPYAADGLKSSSRRVLWTARDGKKYKSATLAGATMPIHPHQSPEGAVNTLAAFYGNNIPLLTGIGAFGTLLNPKAYGASRYTSVKVSEFCKDVVFKDIEIIPKQLNYDDTIEEPVHFLPLVPIALLNPQEGIAVGFSCDILPRTLEDIIISQISHLSNKTIHEVAPCFQPTNQRSLGVDERTLKWVFIGSFKRINTTTLTITELPYGRSHSKYIEILEKLLDQGKIQEITDESRDQYNIKIRFKKGELRKFDDRQLISLLKLENSSTETLNVINFDNNKVLATNYVDLIQKFTDWRLTFYKQRYQRLADLLSINIQKYRDILTAIKHKLGAVAIKCDSRSELKEFCQAIKIIHLDYIVDLSVYRFTDQEKKKVELKLKEAEKILDKYNKLISSENEQRKVYIAELKEVLKKHG